MQEKILQYSDYTVDECGSIFKISTGQKLKHSINGVGYYVTTLINDIGKSNTVYIHRILAIQFISNEYNKPFVNHIDGNKLNNTLSNLEWCTPKENNIHSIMLHGKSRVYNTYICKECAIEFLNSRESVYCSMSCKNAGIKTKEVRHFLSLDITIINWILLNFPMTYIGKLCGYSDNGIRKLLIRRGFLLPKLKKYIKDRPSSLDELISYYEKYF